MMLILSSPVYNILTNSDHFSLCSIHFDQTLCVRVRAMSSFIYIFSFNIHVSILNSDNCVECAIWLPLAHQYSNILTPLNGKYSFKGVKMLEFIPELPQFVRKFRQV